MHELILGGQRSGKSRCAEQRVSRWLGTPGHSAVLVATALAGDGEMRERIERHRADRRARVPQLLTDEVPLALPEAIRRHGEAQRLVVVDCLTLWLTNLLMPLPGAALSSAAMDERVDALCGALRDATGPVVCVSNEIGLGLSPMTSEARRFVDELGRVHQRVAAVCSRVTWMVAGIEVPVKQATA